MRLNASEHAHYNEAMRTKITSNGVDIPFCIWFDTELGMAECCFAIPSGLTTEDDHLKQRPLSSYGDEYTYNEYIARPITIHTYYLHNFEVWQDGQLVEKV
jgi:hypothetical protein